MAKIKKSNPKTKKKTKAQLFSEFHNKRIAELGGELNQSNSSEMEKVDIKISEEYGEINSEMEKYKKQEKKNARSSKITPFASFVAIFGLVTLGFYSFNFFASTLPILMPIAAATTFIGIVLFAGLVFPGNWRKWRSAKLGKGEIKGAYNDVKNLNTISKQVTTAVKTDEEFKKNWDRSEALSTVKKQKTSENADGLTAESLYAEIDAMRRENEFLAQLSANFPPKEKSEKVELGEQEEQVVRNMIAENQRRIDREREIQQEQKEEREIEQEKEKLIAQIVQEQEKLENKEKLEKIEENNIVDERLLDFNEFFDGEKETRTAVNFDLAEQEKNAVQADSSKQKIESDKVLDNNKNIGNKYVFGLSFKITDSRKKGPLVSNVLNIKVGNVDKFVDKLETINLETNRMKTLKNLVENQDLKLFKIVLMAEVTNPENTSEVSHFEFKDLNTYIDFVISTKEALLNKFKSKEDFEKTKEGNFIC